VSPRTVAALLLVGACAKQVHPVSPEVSLVYSDFDPRQPYRTKVRRDVIVGRGITVHGTFDATCEKSREPLFATHPAEDYGTDWFHCNEESTRVVLTCTGPCTVSGTDVMPTAEGTFKLTIELTSKNHYHTETRTFVAKLADTLRVEYCTEGPRLIEPGVPWPRCHLDRPYFVARVMANGKDLDLPVTVRFGDREIIGKTFSLEKLLPITPSGNVVAGEYDLDLSYGTLQGRAKFILAP
jgi:hypothetical protein